MVGLVFILAQVWLNLRSPEIIEGRKCGKVEETDFDFVSSIFFRDYFSSV